MTGNRSLVAWLLGAVVATMHTCAPLAPAFAEGRARRTEPTVAVGPTGSAVDNRAAGRALRDALSAELGTLGGVRLSSRGAARYVVHGSVTRLDHQRLPDGVEVHCEVSLVVADARQGTVRVMLQGRAGARGARDAERLEEVAVQAAVRGALRPLGDSLRGLR